MNEWMNDEAVYRTAPATPGLLTIVWQLYIKTVNKVKSKTWLTFLESIFSHKSFAISYNVILLCSAYLLLEEPNW